MSQNTPLETELFALIGKLTLELEREREKVKEAKKMEKLLNDQLKFERRQSGLAVPSLGIARDINELPPIPPLERNSAKYYPELDEITDDYFSSCVNHATLERDTTQSWLREGVYLGEHYHTNSGLTLADLDC
jgi:hypothetical protein